MNTQSNVTCTVIVYLTLIIGVIILSAVIGISSYRLFELTVLQT